MSAAAVERPHVGKLPSLLEEAEKLTHLLPGHRVEILGGSLTVTPPADGSHAESLTDLIIAFLPAHRGETRVHQAMGVWLPDGPEDYAIPDLAVVDADYRDHLVEANCYDPAIFRMVLEVTSSNYAADLKTKVAAYAIAKIPVYVIVDRRKERIHVLTDPFANEYRTHQIHAAGQQVTLPDSIGAEITLDVKAILETARP
ncbi:membrane protein [Streptomyces albospinus]|uniref:Membrane protein n=1 Tax=Streptomyces albospinus TaxID=285515 RepID=A0ABQ2VAY1_9ACTN|nr:Uma2 family endonuclease [Streptomyces albospinus]GGU77717.1 membrane protein [Streptomyces albospinus]